MAARDEAGDIAGLVRSGFGSLDGACYLLLRIVDPAAARDWLAGIAVTSAADVEAGHLGTARQIAFTARGLRALGFTEADLDAFAPEFLDGMWHDPRRSHRLGDVGANDPHNWRWGTDECEPDAMIALFAAGEAIRGDSATYAAAAAAHGCEVFETLLSIAPRKPGEPGREPFGFADGLTQPTIDWRGTVRVKGAHNRAYRNSVAAGEVLLGHANEYGFVAEHPAALGHNGTYLVLRDIAQDVPGFWREMTRLTDDDGVQALAERLLGRRIDGEPLPGLAHDGDGNFGFANDADGRICPIGSHVRRANPRIGDDPRGNRGWFRNFLATLGFVGTAQRDAVASARFHRILRRGRPYGRLRAVADILAALDAGEDKAGEDGLYFVCLNASLARQFEFVQGAWLNAATFAGLSGQQDPLLGNRQPFPAGCPTGGFGYVDGRGEPRLLGPLPPFTTVRGGAYFFLPGIAGLRAILTR